MTLYGASMSVASMAPDFSAANRLRPPPTARILTSFSGDSLYFSRAARLDERRVDRPRLQRRQSVEAAADGEDFDVFLRRQLVFQQSGARHRVAARTEGRDADDLSFQLLDRGDAALGDQREVELFTDCEDDAERHAAHGRANGRAERRRVRGVP